MTNALELLIVEDERLVAMDLEQRLRGLGYRVVGVAGSGVEAISLATEHRPHLALMDIRLPGAIDGIDAAVHLRSELGVPTVFLTAHSDDATIARAKVADPVGYVTKPFSERELRSTIEIAMHRAVMERKVRESQQWLHTTLRSIGDAVIATDGNDCVRLANRVAESLTGWDESEMLGRPITEVLDVTDAFGARIDPIGEAIRTQSRVETPSPVLLRTKDGRQILIEDSATPIHDAAGRVAGGIIVFRDVTERERVRNHVLHLQRMEAVGRVAGGIAHDFNSLLTVIIGNATLLLDGDSRQQDTQKRLTHIRSSAERAASLTHKLLALSRKQRLQPRELDVHAAVRDLKSMLTSILGEKITLKCDLQAANSCVWVDPAQFDEVLMNLILNARDAMPGGGVARISTRDVSRTGDAQLEIAVSDTGAGMTPEVRAHAFEPFFTTRPFGCAPGLGLATVHGIVVQSGGTIEVETAPGAGATFRIVFPVRLVSPQHAASASVIDLHTRKGTVLVVEDVGALRELIALVLADAGYSVLQAGDASAATRLSESHAGAIDVLIADIVLPKVDGLQLAKAILGQRPDTRVLYMSGYSRQAQIVPENARSAFIGKPFSPNALLVALERLRSQH